jgi:hypothetical protein
MTAAFPEHYRNETDGASEAAPRPKGRIIGRLDHPAVFRVDKASDKEATA